MQKISLLALTLIASAAIEAERFVTATGGYATARQGALGVSNTSAASGAAFPADVLGTTVVTAGAAFAKGASLAVGTSGKAVGSEAGDVIVAVALQAATADGDRVEVFLVPNATPVTGS
jgi:hypothetical protein